MDANFLEKKMMKDKEDHEKEEEIANERLAKIISTGTHSQEQLKMLFLLCVRALREKKPS